jgi:hypothetical protein
MYWSVDCSSLCRAAYEFHHLHMNRRIFDEVRSCIRIFSFSSLGCGMCKQNSCNCAARIIRSPGLFNHLLKNCFMACSCMMERRSFQEWNSVLVNMYMCNFAFCTVKMGPYMSITLTKKHLILSFFFVVISSSCPQSLRNKRKS